MSVEAQVVVVRENITVIRRVGVVWMDRGISLGITLDLESVIARGRGRGGGRGRGRGSGCGRGSGRGREDGNLGQGTMGVMLTTPHVSTLLGAADAAASKRRSAGGRRGSVCGNDAVLLYLS